MIRKAFFSFEVLRRRGKIKAGFGSINVVHGRVRHFKDYNTRKENKDLLGTKKDNMKQMTAHIVGYFQPHFNPLKLSENIFEQHYLAAEKTHEKLYGPYSPKKYSKSLKFSSFSKNKFLKLKFTVKKFKSENSQKKF